MILSLSHLYQVVHIRTTSVDNLKASEAFICATGCRSAQKWVNYLIFDLNEYKLFPNIEKVSVFFITV